jgi:hypothetical protein
METISKVIYSACVIGVVSTFIEIASPQGSVKKQLDLIVGIVLVLVVITPFMNKEFKIRLSDYTYVQDSKIYGELNEFSTQTVLNEARSKVSDYFRQKFNEDGIKYDDIIIKLELNEYNQIEIKRVTVKAQSGNEKRIAQIVKKELPQTEVTVTAGDSS